MEEIKQAEFVSCTTDFWSSIANDSYIGVTVHFLSEDFVLKHRLLCLRKYSEDKTGENIRSAFHSILIEWHLQDKIVPVVTDAASNCVSAFSKTNIDHVLCNAHNLHNSVIHALKIEAVEGLMKRARGIVGHFKHSPKQEN